MNPFDAKIKNKSEKEFILERVTPEEIFIFYLGVKKIYTNHHFISPLRKDKYPTCSFKYCSDGVLRFRDWALMNRSEDCFGIVQYIHKIDFKTALDLIIKDMKLDEKEPNLDNINKINLEYKKITGKPSKSNKSRIDVIIPKSRFRKEDGEYLSQYNITSKIAKKYRVFSIDKVWINRSPVYVRKGDDPCLGYFFGSSSDGKNEGRWKLYFYNRPGNGKNPRFMCNTNRINGWIQIPEKGDFLIITKSLKDVMVLDLFGIPAISMQNETTLPYERIINELKGRFNTIYSLMDFDLTGIRIANRIKKLYNIQPLFLFNGRFGSLNYEAKDISDYIKNFGIEDTIKLMFHAEKLYGKNINR